MSRIFQLPASLLIVFVGFGLTARAQTTGICESRPLTYGWSAQPASDAFWIKSATAPEANQGDWQQPFVAPGILTGYSFTSFRSGTSRGHAAIATGCVTALFERPPPSLLS